MVLSLRYRIKIKKKIEDREVSVHRLVFSELFQGIEHTRPAAAVILACRLLLSEATVRDFHPGAGSVRREFPTDDGAPRFLVVPVAVPGVDEKTWGIELEDFAMALEVADIVHDDRSLLGGITVVDAETGVHLPEFDRAAWIVEPAHEFALIG